VDGRQAPLGLRLHTQHNFPQGFLQAALSSFSLIKHEVLRQPALACASGTRTRSLCTFRQESLAASTGSYRRSRPQRIGDYPNHPGSYPMPSNSVEFLKGSNSPLAPAATGGRLPAEIPRLAPGNPHCHSFQEFPAVMPRITHTNISAVISLLPGLLIFDYWLVRGMIASTGVAKGNPRTPLSILTPALPGSTGPGKPP